MPAERKRKEKEKGKVKGKEVEREREDGGDGRSRAIVTWLRVRGGAVNPLDVDQLNALVGECEAHRLFLPDEAPGRKISGDGWVAEAIEAANRGRDGSRTLTLNFVVAIVDRWRQEGFKAAWGRRKGSVRDLRPSGGGEGIGDELEEV